MAKLSFCPIKMCRHYSCGFVFNGLYNIFSAECANFHIDCSKMSISKMFCMLMYASRQWKNAKLSFFKSTTNIYKLTMLKKYSHRYECRRCIFLLDCCCITRKCSVLVGHKMTALKAEKTAIKNEGHGKNWVHHLSINRNDGSIGNCCNLGLSIQ